MIVDLDDARFSGPVHKRVCVVGTGIGGGSFITRYTRGHDDLVVVEAGSERESTSIQLESIGRQFGLAPTRMISLGGTSNVWRGLSSPLDPIDYVDRPWMPGSGWPIDWSDLEPYYDDAGRILGLPQFEYFSASDTYPEIENLALAFDFSRDLLRNKYFVYTRPPKTFRDDILKRCTSGNDLLMMNAVALELVTNVGGNAIEKVVVRDPGGHSVEVHAEHFVIAAGALETPRLLLNSRRQNERGVGNNHDMVGRCLMDHPMGSISQIRLDKVTNAPLYHSLKLGSRHFVKTGLVLREDVQQQHRLRNHCFYLWPSFKRGIDDRFEALRRALIVARSKWLSVGDVLTLLSNPNTVYRILSYVLPIGAYYKYADLFFVTEQRPNRNSSVSLSEKKDEFGYPMARVNWILSENDLDSIVAFSEQALKALSPTARSVSFEKNKQLIRESLTSAAHHMGTARMSHDERSGVVDRDLRVWNVDNLYICDASVFPTSGNANPSLTICALAIRLADRLKEKH
jgi:choline dehydrogenase-like flavoprotein